MPKPEAITHLILHITTAPWGMAESIRHFHMFVRKPPFADIGYHYVISNPFATFESWRDKKPDMGNDGKVWPGRDIDHDGDIDEEIGAHALGWNSKSLGIAFVGEYGMITGLQLQAALRLCADLALRYEVPYVNIIGHYETGANKTCPDLNMDHFRELLHESN